MESTVLDIEALGRQPHWTAAAVVNDPLRREGLAALVKTLSTQEPRMILLLPAEDDTTPTPAPEPSDDEKACRESLLA